VPTAAPLSFRQVGERIAALAGLSQPRVVGIPHWLVRGAGLAVPMLRELDEVWYQSDRPFVMDSSAFQSAFGLAPTPVEEALAQTVAAWRAARPAA
jgi:nucleoside-diphosphate-sugar epimerase